MQNEYKNKRRINSIKQTNDKNDEIITLSNLAIKTNDEINKNNFLTQTIQLKKNQIKNNKLFLSKFSVNINNQSKKEIEKELRQNNKILLELNNSLKNEIKNYQDKIKINSIILQRNIEQQNNVLEALKESNFILENKINEKEWLIMRIKELLCNYVLNIDDIELLKDIDQVYFGQFEEGDKIIEYILILNLEFYQEFLLYKSIKYNKAQNKFLRLTEEKNNLQNFINEYKNQKSKIKIEIENKNKIYLENIINDSNSNINEKNNYKPTNETTDNTLININDSLYFDTDEQIDIEFPENDFSSYYLSQKNLGLNIFKKKVKVPPLDFKLIEYNKLFMDSSMEEKSLSRDLEEDIDYKVKVLKKKIKSMNKQNKKLEIKCEKYEKKIKQMSLFLYSKLNNVNLKK